MEQIGWIKAYPSNRSNQQLCMYTPELTLNGNAHVSVRKYNRVLLRFPSEMNVQEQLAKLDAHLEKLHGSKVTLLKAS
jgi:hypothetical protein